VRRQAHARRTISFAVLALALTVLFVGGFGRIPSARATNWTTVDLGTHRFGHLTRPEAIVARVGADGVAFDDPGEDIGVGPWSFDIATDGSAWLLDQGNSRLLVRDPGKPEGPARTVPLPQGEIHIAADLALGANGTIYVSYVPTSPGPRKTLKVCALSPTGTVLWTTATDIQYINSRLREAPDGSVYWEGPTDTPDGVRTGFWTPVSSPEGHPLSLSQQRAGSTPYQPMPGGLRFEEVEVGEGAGHEWDFTLLDPSGHEAGAWRMTSEDDLGGTIDEPAMAHGLPIVTVDVARQTPNDYLYEYVALPLPVGGGEPTEISLDPHAVWGDTPVTGVRVGPDGDLYQLRTDIDTGVSIARYSFVQSTPTPASSSGGRASPTPSVATSPSASPSGTETQASSAAAFPTNALATPTASRSARSWILPAAVIAVALAGLAWWAILRYRAARREG